MLHHTLGCQLWSTKYLVYDTRYTAIGRIRKARTPPRSSSRIAFHSGRGSPPSRLRMISHTADSSAAPPSARTPDHLVDAAAPNANPAANRHGRQIGEGTGAGWGRAEG